MLWVLFLMARAQSWRAAPRGWTWYRIHGRVEETECDHCGWPAYSGQTMLIDSAETYVACGPRCARRLEARRRVAERRAD